MNHSSAPSSYAASALSFLTDKMGMIILTSQVYCEESRDENRVHSRSSVSPGAPYSVSSSKSKVLVLFNTQQESPALCLAHSRCSLNFVEQVTKGLYQSSALQACPSLSHLLTNPSLNVLSKRNLPLRPSPGQWGSQPLDLEPCAAMTESGHQGAQSLKVSAPDQLPSHHPGAYRAGGGTTQWHNPPGLALGHSLRWRL